MSGPATGWPPGLLQDDDRRLSRALANAPHARRNAEQAAAAMVHDHRTGETHLVPVVAVDLDVEVAPSTPAFPSTQGASA